MTKTTLKNGLRIGNFSSPHPFRFNTGEVLDGVSPDESRMLSLERTEKESAGTDSRFSDVEISFQMTNSVWDALEKAEAMDDVDIIIVPLPIKTAMETAKLWTKSGKFRTCVLSDRVTKTVHSDKFGV